MISAWNSRPPPPTSAISVTRCQCPEKKSQWWSRACTGTSATSREKIRDTVTFPEELEEEWAELFPKLASRTRNK